MVPVPDLLSVIGALAIAVTLHWQFALCFGIIGQLICTIGPKRPKVEHAWRVAGRMHQELWIAAPPGIVLAVVESWHSGLSWMVFFHAVSLYQWWHYRNWPDENRWKRRGRKAVEAVAMRAGRLVVVPSGVTS